MRKLTNQQLNRVSKNLDRYFNLATDEQIADGLKWYKEANLFCKDTALNFNVCPLLVASVVSALSPRNKWHTNLKDAINVLDAVSKGKGPNDIKVSTFHTNKFKAFALANGQTDITNDSRKTYAFVRNVGQLDINRVTIDVWHLRACFGETVGALGKLAYDQLEALTIKKAKQLGLNGYEYQAIVWCSVRENF